jgi:hypothetical protein
VHSSNFLDGFHSEEIEADFHYFADCVEEQNARYFLLAANNFAVFVVVEFANFGCDFIKLVGDTVNHEFTGSSSQTLGKTENGKSEFTFSLVCDLEFDAISLQFG